MGFSLLPTSFLLLLIWIVVDLLLLPVTLGLDLHSFIFFHVLEDSRVELALLLKFSSVTTEVLEVDYLVRGVNLAHDLLFIAQSGNKIVADIGVFLFIFKP